MDRLCDADEKFEFFNTAGGLVIHREIDRLKDRKKQFTDDSWSAFTFFLFLFSQVFTTTPSKSLFSTQFVDMVERHCRTNKSISYQKKFDVCSDGFVRSTISYNVAKFDRLVQEGDEGKMHAIYDTVPETFGVDFKKNSNGYYPKKNKKRFLNEQLVYSRRISSETYEDRGYKHLYEKHHSCKKNRSQCKFCNSVICRAGKAEKRSVNFKKDDMFQVENEEMSCDNVSVNYSKLIQFYDERNKIDLKQKNDSFTTLIPPPLYDEGSKSRGVKVYVTEINADFCNNDISPLTVQDPVWVNYASVNSKHQHPPPATSGVLHSTAVPGPGFILDDLPGGRVFAYP